MQKWVHCFEIRTMSHVLHCKLSIKYVAVQLGWLTNEHLTNPLVNTEPQIWKINQVNHLYFWSGKRIVKVGR